MSSAYDWRAKAACRDKDPELFFPVGNTGPALMQIQEAKKVCKRCDVREACLQWALDAGQDHGVHALQVIGGVPERERLGTRHLHRAGSVHIVERTGEGDDADARH